MKSKAAFSRPSFLLRTFCLVCALLSLSLPDFTSASASASADFEVLPSVDTAFLRAKPKLDWGRDPFLRQPGFGPLHAAMPKELKLEAIIYNKNQPTAMINGSIVRVGGTLSSGAKVVEIHPKYVLVRDGSSLRELIIRPPETNPRQPASSKGDAE